MARHSVAGFSLVEVMVALLVTCFGVLGMLAMQGRTIAYAQDTILRSSAAELADELMEMMRTDIYSTQDGSAAQVVPPSSWGYYKAASASFPIAPGSCASLAKLTASQRLACWAQRVNQALPGASDLAGEFHVCRTNGSSTCSNSGSAIEIQLAWRVKAGECLDANATGDNTICRYVLREEP
ncbi:type IV pilus modification protein PilV [Pseudomonas sp. PDM18]|uniref:type IV pilus modification protein PilV n=1 Tax=Pseudomonas sp. PDM18 TaxID=2769253 RepID=UPI00178260BF|nr:type IV pilus modification protein PilV [Pseudomonas sp. PDM18]MBD9678715.1 type IV pilus modification protein PilV [Pseudomonas sp. PDM18]